MVKTIPEQSIPAFMSYVGTRPGPQRLAMMLMLEAGLRVGEVCSLVWAQLYYDSGPLAALNLAAFDTKYKRARVLPISKPLADTIQAVWTNHAQPKYIPPAAAATALAPHGGPISPRSLQRHVKAAGLKAIRQDITPHTLRHTFATRLLRVSNLEIVRQALGHQRLGTTQIYVHPTTDEIADAIGKIPQT